MKIGDYLSREEVAYFSSKSDFHAWRLVLGNWMAIAVIFALVGAYPNPLTILLAIVLLAGRQLGLSVLMHDCGHRTLFKRRQLNDNVGQWLCGLPVLNDQPAYARGHLQHHRRAGSDEDPDLPNYQAYPVSMASFRRKVIRDLSGQTGIKVMVSILRGASGAVTSEQRSSHNTLFKQLAVQLALWLILYACGIGWTYSLWLIAYLTVFMLLIRVRQVAEHAAVPDLFDPDPRKNTRTVVPPWWQRLLFAPNGVNYHLEHHFMASVPCYRLRELHELLLARQALDGVPAYSGYGAVLRHAVTA